MAFASSRHRPVLTRWLVTSLLILFLMVVGPTVPGHGQISKSGLVQVARFQPAPSGALPRYRLTVHAALIADRKANGSGWDVGGGPPDPFIKIKIIEPRTGTPLLQTTTEVRSNTLQPVWNQVIGEVQVGDRIAFEVLDKDIAFNDPIGNLEMVITEKHLTGGKLKLTFQQVRELTLSLVPVDPKTIVRRTDPPTQSPKVPVKPSPPDPIKPPEQVKLPPDLALIPPDVSWFVSLRSTNLFNSDVGVQMLLLFQLSESGFLPAVEKWLGAPVADIERIVVCGPRGQAETKSENCTLLVTTLQPFQPAAIRAIVGPESQDRRYQGKVIRTAGEKDLALHLVDDRTFVLGSLGAVQTLLNQLPAVAAHGHLREAVALAASKRLLVAAATVPDLSNQLPAADEVPPEFRALLPLLAVKAVTWFTDINGMWQSDLQLRFASAAEAQAGVKAIETALELARESWRLNWASRIAPVVQEVKRLLPAEIIKQLREKPETAEFFRKNPQDLKQVAEKGLKFTSKVLELFREYEPLFARWHVEANNVSTRASFRVRSENLTMGLPAVLLPAVASVKKAATRTLSFNNLKQLAFALQCYHDVHRRFPPPAVYSKDGTPLLSWRVLILPFLDEEKLFKEFKLDESWDSPHNKKLLERMPAVYQDPTAAPGSQHRTRYQAFTGNRAALSRPPVSLFRLPDGASNTLLLAEGAEAVPWTKPVDLEFDLEKPTPKWNADERVPALVAYADGVVSSLPVGIPDKVVRALIDRADGAVVNREQFSLPPSSSRVKHHLEQLRRALIRYAELDGKAPLPVRVNENREQRVADPQLPLPAIYSKDGKPLLSWRVQLLPFLGEEKLFQEFRLDEPWDSPHNKKLLNRRPEVFAPRDPKWQEPHLTCYQVCVGRGAAFEERQRVRLADFPDGLRNTLLVLETEEAVPWTRPGDLVFEAGKPLTPLRPLLRGQSGHPLWDNFAVFGAGVHRLPSALPEPKLRALITRKGGEAVSPEGVDPLGALSSGGW